MSQFLKALLKRSEYLAVERGRIILIPANGDTTTSETWLRENWLRVASELLRVTGHVGFIYKGYSTGLYTGHKAGGVTLQLYNPANHQAAFAIFNANLKRLRTTKYGSKGAPLPKGHFTLGKNSGFVQFWCDMGLELPKRLSAFHDCMGKLNQLLITAITNDNDKIINRSLSPLTIEHQELIKLFSSPDNSLTISRQNPDKQPTRIPDKDLSKPLISCCTQNHSGTCLNNYGIKVKGTTDKGDMPIQLLPSTSPQEQTVDEWLDDYAGGNHSEPCTVHASNKRHNKKTAPPSWHELKKAL